MLKWINVKEFVPVELDESKSIGMMRLDWSGSRRDEVCNKWLPLFKVETTDFNFYLRLKPVKDEYSYLFIYHR